ncbi:MAG TPA: XRE family transcriptional regulator, partial [Gordonia polyisoprenivorans]|nr:XRE family transcriptional regulator [Gordonia polyisoprenivorans]
MTAKRPHNSTSEHRSGDDPVDEA